MFPSTLGGLVKRFSIYFSVLHVSGILVVAEGWFDDQHTTLPKRKCKSGENRYVTNWSKKTAVRHEDNSFQWIKLLVEKKRTHMNRASDSTNQYKRRYKIIAQPFSLVIFVVLKPKLKPQRLYTFYIHFIYSFRESPRVTWFLLLSLFSSQFSNTFTKVSLGYQSSHYATRRQHWHVHFYSMAGMYEKVGTYRGVARLVS